MNLLIVGINHNSAPVALREKVAFTPEQLSDALGDIRQHAGAAEVAILSTCNRTEIIACGDKLNPSDVGHWLAGYHELKLEDLESSIYIRTEREAAQHAMRVAAGLDSMVVGEPQILGQVKECYDYARQAGTLGPELDHLSQTTFRVAKQVRTDTAIGESSVSVASTAVTLAQQLFTDLPGCSVMLIGAGDTARLVGKHLTSAGIHRIVIANRTIENARTLASELNGDAIDLQTLPNRLPETDIVIASTAAQLPVLGKGTVERALRTRKHKPILMVDLAVPRDIEPEVAELMDIYLYSVDDLQQIIDANLDSRQEAAGKAEDIIRAAARDYRSRATLRVTDQTVARFRAVHNDIKQQELDKALARLDKGDAPDEVIRQLANQLTNKIIHTPSVRLKSAAEAGNDDVTTAILNLFDLDKNVE